MFSHMVTRYNSLVYKYMNLGSTATMNHPCGDTSGHFISGSANFTREKLPHVAVVA